MSEPAEKWTGMPATANAQRDVLAAAIHDRIAGIGGEAHRAHQEADAVAAGWDRATFRARVDAAVAMALGESKMSQAMRLMTSEKTVECYTPPPIVVRVRQALGGAIDLDPASSDVANRTVQAAAYFTKDDDGFRRRWHGRVFLNPPFDDTPRWVKRLGAAYDDGEIAAGVLLVNSAPGYQWWTELTDTRPAVVLAKRLTFLRADGTPYDNHHKKGQTVAYFGPDVDAFAAAFGDLGRLLLSVARTAGLFEMEAA